jgi:hypothetical protein
MTALPIEQTLNAVGHFIVIGGALILIIALFVVSTVQIFRTFRALCLLT